MNPNTGANGVGRVILRGRGPNAGLPSCIFCKLLVSSRGRDGVIEGCTITRKLADPKNCTVKPEEGT